MGRTLEQSRSRRGRLVLLALGLLAAVVFTSWLLFPRHDRRHAAEDSGNEPSSSPGPVANRVASSDVPREAPEADCLSRLRDVIDERAQLLRTMGRSLPPEQAFSLDPVGGEPPASLSRLLAHRLDSISPRPEHTLQCNFAACRLRILSVDRTNAWEWRRILMQDPDISPLIPRADIGRCLPVSDASSGDQLSECETYFSLEDGTPTPAVATREPPPDPRDCTAKLEAQRHELRAMAAFLQDSRGAAQAFEGQREPDLEASFTADVKRILGDQTPPGASVECRNHVCLVRVPETLDPSGPWPPWSTPLETDPELRKRLRKKSFRAPGVYFQIEKPGLADGFPIITDLVDAIKADPRYAECWSLPGVPGMILETTLDLPCSPGCLNADGEEGKISLRFGGELADQPIGLCLENVVRDLTAKVTLPPRVTGLADFVSHMGPPRVAQGKQ
jgi:hypothetical protein